MKISTQSIIVVGTGKNNILIAYDEYVMLFDENGKILIVKDLVGFIN